MEKKAKIGICKCGNGIPPRSNAKICLDCTDKEEKIINKIKLKKILNKPRLEVKRINKSQKPACTWSGRTPKKTKRG